MYRVTTCLAMVAMLVSLPAQGSKFSFVALGDTAYNIPGDYPVYQALIKTINASRPAFTIHVGDTWGVNTCSESEHERILGFFQEYDHPVIYTPGDNEWADCADSAHIEVVTRFVAGNASKEDLAIIASGTNLDVGFERRLYGDWFGSLQTIRKTFFSTSTSLGQHPVELMRQADISEFDQMVENAIWEHGDVLFGTVHVSGSANNFIINDEARAMEAVERNKANFAWIRRIFAEAKARDASAACWHCTLRFSKTETEAPSPVRKYEGVRKARITGWCVRYVTLVQSSADLCC